MSELGELEDFDPHLAGLYKWADIRSCGKPAIADALRGLANAYVSLHATCAHEEEDPNILINDFAELVGGKSALGRPREYGLDAELREIDRLPHGKKSTAIQALARRKFREPETLKGRLIALRREERQRQKTVAAREAERAAWLRDVAENLKSDQ